MQKVQEPGAGTERTALGRQVGEPARSLPHPASGSASRGSRGTPDFEKDPRFCVLWDSKEM